MVILPIGSGKGGVGKSLLATNLSIALAEAGKRVVLADLDLGASNLHTMLGMRTVSQGIGTFLTASKVSFQDIVLPTEYPGLSFIPGDAEMPGMANLKSPQKKRLVRNLMALEADFLILDLGAGTPASTIDFFLLSRSGIIITTPALTAILNAYLFLKNAIFRIMYSTFQKGSRAFEYLEELRREGGALQKVFIPKILSKIRTEDPESHAKFVELAGHFRPRLVLNLLDDPRDAEKAGKLRRSSREYLDVELEHLGIIYRDELQDTALGSRLPIIRYKPTSVLSQAIYRIAEKVLTLEDAEGLMDIEDLDDTFQAAEVEAETDFQIKRNNLEELLQSGALSMGDLIETIRTQLFEIQTLRKENQLLKTKLVRAIEDGYKA
jgi:flagellar biosynthesis protein FlhG